MATISIYTSYVPVSARPRFRSAAGALADDAEWDSIMEEIYQQRKGGKQ